MNDKTVKIVAIVVTYRPELSQIQRLMTVLESQVTAVVVVDNYSGLNSRAIFNQIKLQNTFVIELNENYGLGYAQNTGIRWARNHAATHVLLMDQDSLPGEGMVAALLAAVQNSENVAAVGPRYEDNRYRFSQPFVRLRGFRFKRLAWLNQPIVAVDCLISSGSLIPLTALDKVGSMREDLFIDYVDTEWCLRARRDGLQSYGVCDAAMVHSLGEEPVFLFGRTFPVHSPLRRYYQVRNALILCRETWIPLNWKIAIVCQSLLKIGFYSLIVAPRKQHFKMMMLGLWHAALGRTGKHLP